MMALKSAWPLVLFAVVSSTYVLALTKRHNVCDVCEDNETGRIRLRDPARNGSSGQIEICVGNYWQTVCGSRDPQQPHLFTDNDSTVACFQLGFTKGDPGARGSGCLPGRGHATYLVVKPPCHGWEEKLFPLHLLSITDGGCTPRTAVSVTCEATVQVKLMHGEASSYLGRVMHYFNSSWRTVCDGNWTATMSNSHVLCRQLGLGHALEHWLHDRGETDIHFLHTDMSCSGTEDKLRMCNHIFTTNDTCSGKSVPWVVCSGPEANDFNISTSYTSITLRWTVPEALQYYSVVQGYNITYTEKEAGDGSKAAVPLDQLEVTLRGLKSGTQYYVTVLVVLTDGRPGPETTLVVSTTSTLVAGLATGLAVCGALLLCVLLVATVEGIALLKRRRGNLPQPINVDQEFLQIQENDQRGDEDPPPVGDPPQGEEQRPGGNPPPAVGQDNEERPLLNGQPEEPQQQLAGHPCLLL